MPKLELPSCPLNTTAIDFVLIVKYRNLARNHKSVCACYVKHRSTTSEYVKLIASRVPLLRNTCWFSVQGTVYGEMPAVQSVQLLAA
jgi:hypothetical protein